MAKQGATKKASRSAAGDGPVMLVSRNPRTGDVIREIPAVAPAEVREIVEQARKVAPEWAAIPPKGRAHIMREVRFRLHDLMEEVVETVATECGKPRTEALAHDVLPVAVLLSYIERITPRVLRDERHSRVLNAVVGARTWTERRPFGVVGAITPWNYPMTNSFLAFASALFAGNTVVIKPSEVTPACGELLRRILEPLPAGVATVIQGGGDVGAALVDAPCDKISFIGSPATGRKICAAAAEHLTPVVMELGGNDAAIVTADADLDLASSGIAWGAFANAGQTCAAVERVYVADAVADRFEEMLVSKVSRLQLGDEVGPLIFDKQLGTVESQVDDALEKGARRLTGGGRPAGRDGQWYPPTILEDVTQDMKVLKEESFGPVLTLVRVRDEEEAISRATREGVCLTASVWTTDDRQGERIAQRLEAGGISFNMHTENPASPWTPWGGKGESGFGRLNGAEGLLEFSVPVARFKNTIPGGKRLWWYPYDEATHTALRGATELLLARDMRVKAKALGAVASNAVKALKQKI